MGPGSPLVSLSLGGGDTERRQLQRAPRRAAWIFTLDDRKKRTKPGGTEVYRLSASLKSTNSKVKGNCYSFIGGINCGPREGLLPATPPPQTQQSRTSTTDSIVCRFGSKLLGLLDIWVYKICSSIYHKCFTPWPAERLRKTVVISGHGNAQSDAVEWSCGFFC